MRARYYSADAGVFLSTDPVKNIGPTWLPLAYAYAESNPLRFNDPNGEFINWLVAAVTSVVGAIVNAAMDLVTQLWQNDWDFGKVSWGRVGVAAGVGFVQGGIAGLTMGASIPAQIALGAAVGGAASFVQTGLGNLTEGKAFVESWQGALIDVGLGAATGAIPGGGKGGGVKAKPKLKAPTALSRAKTGVALPRVSKPTLSRSASAPALLATGSGQSASGGVGSAFREAGLWGATDEFPWSVGSGLFADKLKEWAGVD